MIDSGKMRERVALQRPVDRQNEFGEATLEWEEVAVVWANVMNLTARDYFAAQQSGTLATHRITIRYYAVIKPTWRMLWRGRLLEITSIAEREFRRLHEIIAKEVVE